MDALAVPSPKISMGTIYQVTKLMDDKHVTHVGFLALPPQNIRKLYSTRWTFGGQGHRECGNVKKIHASSAPKNGQLHNEPVVHFRKTGLVYRQSRRCVALVVNWLVSVGTGRQPLFSDLVFRHTNDTGTNGPTVLQCVLVFGDLGLTNRNVLQAASRKLLKHSVLSYETNQQTVKFIQSFPSWSVSPVVVYYYWHWTGLFQQRLSLSEFVLCSDKITVTCRNSETFFSVNKFMSTNQHTHLDSALWLSHKSSQ